jgi:hypothetical protein
MPIDQANVLHLDLMQAEALAVDPQLQVSVMPVEGAEYPASLELEPCSSDDWELVELHATYLEAELLRQVRLWLLYVLRLLWRS